MAENNPAELGQVFATLAVAAAIEEAAAPRPVESAEPTAETMRHQYLAAAVASAPPTIVDRLCVVMHNAYEEAAIANGWATQESTRVPWNELPQANRDTMRASVRALLSFLTLAYNIR